MHSVISLLFAVFECFHGKTNKAVKNFARFAKEEHLPQKLKIDLNFYSEQLEILNLLVTKE